MLEDLSVLTSLRKRKLGMTEAYFKRCSAFVANGSVPVCVRNCNVCEGVNRYVELLKFYAMRNKTDRPERKLALS